MTAVCAVVVTWNRWQLLRACLEALWQQTRRPDGILIVDNASTDGTPERLAAEGWLARPGIVYLRLADNRGGAGGFAAGMRQALGPQLARQGSSSASDWDWLWLMDDDTEPQPSCLAELLSEAERHPRAGALGSLLERHDGSGLIQECGARLSRLLGKPQFLQAGQPISPAPAATSVDYLAACSLLARVTALRDVGVFDERLFVFYDDVDWGLRLRRRGWQLRTAPRSIARHPWHAAKPAAPWRWYCATRNQILVLARHRRGCLRLLVILIWAGWAGRWAARFRRAGRHGIAAAIQRGLADLRPIPLGLPALPVDSGTTPPAPARWTDVFAALSSGLTALDRLARRPERWRGPNPGHDDCR